MPMLMELVMMRRMAWLDTNTNTTDIARQYIIRIRVEDGFHFHFQTSKSDVLLNV